MKITFILPFAGLSGGVRVVALYARELAARGHDVRVVSQPASAPSLRDRLRALAGRHRAAPPVASPLFAPLGARHTVLGSPRPVTSDDLEDADFVVATWWETAEWVAALPASKGQKIYLLQDYEMFPMLPHDRVAATYHAGLKMIAVSSYIRSTIAQRHGVEGIDLLLNGVDTDQFDAPERGRGTPLTIGYLFQHSERKNMPLAAEIIAKTRARIPGLRVLAFGSEAPSAATPLPEGVEFHLAPSQARIPGIYASCDAWIVPSRVEGFGLPLLEAMACRTPVLATRFGASGDVVRDGRNGWLLPFDADAFADKLHLMSRMPGWEWARMSSEARATALSWGWAGRVDALEQRLTAWRGD